MNARLSSREIGLIRYLGRHHAAGVPDVHLGQELRHASLPLYRRYIVEIWRRQYPDTPTDRGPVFSLSESGLRLYAAIERTRATFDNSIIVPAPRGFSGAESVS